MENKTTDKIALIIVISFITIYGIMALLPYIMGLPPHEYTEHMKEYESMYSGIIGIIIGYYFHKGKDAIVHKDDTKKPNNP